MKTHTHPLQSKLMYTSIYIVLLILSFIFIGTLWSLFITNRWYVCTDTILVLDFIPPFVHNYVDPHDYYVLPPYLVWTVWVILFGSLFWIPKKLLDMLTHKLDKQ